MSSEVPVGWSHRRLRDLVEIAPDSISAAAIAELEAVAHYSLPAFDAGRAPEITAGRNIKSNKSLVPHDCVLFSKLNPRIPRVWRIRERSPLPSVCSTEFWPLVSRSDDVDLDFLAALISSDTFLGDPQIAPSSSTNSHQRVDRTSFQNYIVCLPSREEQQRIAEVLRSTQRAFDLADATAGRLRSVLTALRTALTHDPDTAPEALDRVALNNLCRPRQHPVISSQQLTEIGYPAYGANGQIGFYTSFTHANPVIAITCRGATCGTINWIPGPAYVTGNAMALDEVRHDLINERFLFHWLSAWGVAKSISGSAQPQITRQSLNGIKIVLPPLEAQASVAAILDDVQKQLEVASLTRSKLKSVCAQVTSDLLSGRVRVPA